MEAWEKRLGLLNETLDEWVAVQRNWMYLETIFCAEDIQKQLPDEAAKFQVGANSRNSYEASNLKRPVCAQAGGTNVVMQELSV